MPIISRQSHHLLPVSSAIFPRNQSSVNFRDHTQVTGTQEATSTTAFTEFGEQPDDEITALPAASEDSSINSFGIYQLRKKTKSASLASPPPATPRQEDPFEVTEGLHAAVSYPNEGGKEDGRNKAAKAARKDGPWRRLVDKIKKRLRALKAARKGQEEKVGDAQPPLVIGSPTNFQHLQTSPLSQSRGFGTPRTISAPDDFSRFTQAHLERETVRKAVRGAEGAESRSPSLSDRF